MPIHVSRRRWLLSTILSAASASSLWSDEPGDHVANASGGQLRRGQSNRGQWLPPTSRSIQLSEQPSTAPVITAIAVDPRGEMVAVAGDDHLIRILNTSALIPVLSLSGHRDLIRTLTFDPSGGRLASAGNDGQLMLWDRDQSFGLLQRLSGTPALTCVRFSPEGDEMAAVGFGAEVFRIGRTEAEQTTFRCEGTDLRAVAYRDDGAMLAVAGRSGGLNLFDLASGVGVSHPLHDGRIHGVAFHYNSPRAVCVADDGRVTVFDTQNRELIHRVAVTTGKLFAVAVLNSQLVAVAGSDNIVRIVNTDDGTLIRRLEGHSGSVSALGAGGGLLFSGSYDTTLRRWPINEITAGGQRIAEGDPRIDR